MLSKAVSSRVQLLVLLCVFLTTIFVTPGVNLDSINLPKFVVLITSGFGLLGILVFYVQSLGHPLVRPVLYSTLFFIFSLVTVFVVHGSMRQLYGAHGRNTGFLSYFSLAILLLSASLVTTKIFAHKLIWTLTITGTINAVYGLIQWMGMDPVDWSNPYNPIIGTLGNPNFASAHLGISGVSSMAIMFGETRKRIRIFLAMSLTLSIFVIYVSDSMQGLLIFALGVGVTLFFKFLRRRTMVILKLGYLLLSGAAIFFGVLGILGKGFLASILYQDSVKFRGDYWRAGWKMTIENPFFGVGLDAYGDWYRFSRDELAAIRRGPNIVTNSAHNVFLDISSNGGFLLAISYVSVIVLILRSGLRLLSKSVDFDYTIVGLVTAWLAYLIQSTVSINQLGLAVWGWSLGGTIIGLDLYLNGKDKLRIKNDLRKKGELVPAGAVLTGMLGLLTGLVLGVLPFAKDVAFRSALEIRNADEIQRAASRFPANTFYFNYAAKIFLENNLIADSLALSKKSTLVNDREFNAWEAIFDNPGASRAERNSALEKMRQLDPFNKTLQK